jgi:hypothetical protein
MTEPMRLIEVELDDAAWGLQPGDATADEHLGRRCLRFADAYLRPTVAGPALADGVIEADLAVTAERSFHGLAWRARDGENFEEFFVRPHQVGNPDAIQYTPVTNGISSWQLYHGDGYWAPTSFPVGPWFTLRVAFAGERADVWVGDLDRPALRVAQLKLDARAGAIGLLVGGPGLRVARFAHSDTPPALEPMALPARDEHAIRAWHVSDPFPERAVDAVAQPPGDLLVDRRWTRLEAEPGGLANLGRVNGLHGEANTVLVRAVLRADDARTIPMQLGFSDRAMLFLNGRALFRGDDTYRSRDYRFLGSIGFWDTVFLPLEPGENELVVAVSEDFGGWGIQARFPDVDDATRVIDPA